jgi:hypothetical protein
MDTKVIELIAGAFMPFVIDLVNKYVANSNYRYFISIGFCLVLGAIFNFDKLNPADILTSGAIIFAAAQTVYKTYYQKSDVRAKVFGNEITKRE